jgi:hypothetical protein
MSGRPAHTGGIGVEQAASGADRRDAVVAAMAARAAAAVGDRPPLAHDTALLVTGRRCTSGRSTPGPITAAVQPAVSHTRQRPWRPGVATSSMPIGQPQQTHKGTVTASPGVAGRFEREAREAEVSRGIGGPIASITAQTAAAGR